MKNLHISLKNFLMLLCLLAMFPFAILLTACDGGGSGTVTPDRTIMDVSCAIRDSSVNYTFVNDYEIRIAHDANIYSLIGNQDFIVTVYYSDGTNEVVNLGYTVNIVDHTSEGMYYDYTIEVSYSGIDYTICSINVIVDAEMLPMFTNLSAIGDIYSGYNFTEELRYTGNEYDVSEMIVTGDGTTLAELVAQNKVTLDTSNYGCALPTCTYQTTNPNVYCGNDQYDNYSFIIRANRGYQWEIEGQAVDSLTVNWQIKRQIIDTPVLTSATEFTYQHRAETVNGQTTYVGVPQSLTFNYGNGALYVTPADQQTDHGMYQTVLRVKDECDEFYTFMINGEERDSVWFDWSITPMQLTRPTIAQNHYTYTGSEIKPAVISDYLDLFDITYPTWCVAASSENSWYQIGISLKPEYYYSYNYNLGYDESNPVYNVNLNYYIDPASFPTAIATDLDNINFVLEKDLNYDYGTYASSMTYEEYVNALYKGDFVNSVVEMAEFQDQYDSERWSRFEFELPDTMPDGLTADSYLDANTTTGYPVKVMYWYDQTNYQPYTFTAILKIKPKEMPINTTWQRWISTTGYSGYINTADSEIVYDPEATYGYYLNNFHEIAVNYTIYYGTTENNINTPVNAMSNAGYYRIVATLVAPNNNNTNNFLIYDEDDNSKTPIASLTYPNIIHISPKPVSFWAYSGTVNYVNTCENYYVEGVARSIDKPTLHDTLVLPYVDDQNDQVERVTYYRANQNAAWTVAENTIDVGYYKTVFTWHLNDQYNDGNYQLVSFDADTNANVDGGFATVEWYIYPNTYALQTTNPNADGYIGWLNNDEFSVYYNNNYDWFAELPVTKPDGIGIDYMYDNAHYNSETGVWQSSGSQNSSNPSETGDYLMYANFYVKNIAGWDQVTVTVDGEARIISEGHKIIYSTNSKHLAIVEQTPSNIVLNNNVTFNVGGYKYFSFTTGDATEYMIITNESNAVFNLRLANGTDYTYLQGARLNNSQSYYLLHELEPNTNYVLRIGPNSNSTEGTRSFMLMVYPEQLDFEYSNAVTVYDFTNGTTTSGGFVISAHDVNVGETVTVPATVYAGVPTNPDEPMNLTYSAHDVIAITANGFENNTMTRIDLPFIKNIGDHAFKNCTNLREIHFAYYNGDWKNIVFGKNAFEGCTNLTLYTGNGGIYHVSEDGSITEINA
ncbi:MAG: leucine-rich repeat protein [Clostridia bacterium]|nr:leucine-rich repeat protein [Clostridia bacterium]